MLVTLKEILKIAEEQKIAIGAFNGTNLTSLKAVISAAEELNQPVIVMHAQVHEEMGLCNMEEIAPIMLFFAKRAKVPVCVHLDHGTDLDYVKRGLELGFTSVLYDGSTLDEELNYANTCIARELSYAYGASLEAEIGSMGARESAAPGESSDESIYTDPFAAKKFVEETGIDTQKHSGTVEQDGSETRVFTRGMNLGVMTTQQLIREQRELVQFTVCEFITNSFKTEFCLLVY